MTESPPKDAAETIPQETAVQAPAMTPESQKVVESPPRTQNEERELEKIARNLSAHKEKSRIEKAGKAVAGGAAGVAGVGAAYGAGGAIATPVIESGVTSLVTGTGWAASLLKVFGPLAFFGAILYKLKDIPAYLAQVANGEKLKIPAAKGGGGGKKDDHGHGGGGGHH